MRKLQYLRWENILYIELKRTVLLFNEEEIEKITVFNIREYIIYRTKKNCSFI